MYLSPWLFLSQFVLFATMNMNLYSLLCRKRSVSVTTAQQTWHASPNTNSHFRWAEMVSMQEMQGAYQPQPLFWGAEGSDHHSLCSHSQETIGAPGPGSGRLRFSQAEGRGHAGMFLSAFEMLMLAVWCCCLCLMGNMHQHSGLCGLGSWCSQGWFVSA